MAMEDDFTIRIETLNVLGEAVHRDEAGFFETNDLMLHRLSHINELDGFVLVEFLLQLLD